MSPSLRRGTLKGVPNCTNKSFVVPGHPVAKVKRAGISTSSGTGDGSWASKSDGQARGWGQGRGGMEPKLAKQLANPMLVRRGELWPVQDGERGRGGAWHSRESTQTLQ